MRISTSARTILKTSIAAAAICLASAKSHATSIFLDLNNDAFKAKIDTRDADNTINFSVAALITEDDGELFTGTAYTYGNLEALPEATGGLGARLYHANVPGDNFQSLGLGGFLEFGVQQVPGLSLGVELFYSPSITISDDYDSLTDISVYADYQAFENASIYLGFRDINVDYGSTDGDINDGVYLGLHLDI